MFLCHPSAGSHGIPCAWLALTVLVQLYECVYLLVEGRCSYASPCCPSSPGTPVNMSRATTRSLSPKPSPQQPLPSPAPQLSQQQQDHPQEQHHEEQQEEQAGLTLTRSVSLDDCFIRQDYVAIDLQPLQPIQSGIVADVSTGAAGRRGGALPAASPFAGAGAGAAVGVPLVKLTSSRVKMLFRSGNIFSLSALNVFGVYIGERLLWQPRHDSSDFVCPTPSTVLIDHLC